MNSTQGAGKSRIEKDAEGQFAKSQGDRKSSGVAAAKPTVLTPRGSEDSTIHRLPPGDKKPGGVEWDPQF